VAQVVVTGASGYLGGRLVEHLVAGGHHVRAIGRQPPPWLMAAGGDHEVVDLARDVPPSALAGADAVVHLAAPNEVEAGDDPAGTVATTVAITANVGRAAAAASVGRVVYLSTVHVYGPAIVDGAVLTETTATAPTHPYAVARLQSEQAMAREIGDDRLVVLRLTNAVGAPAAPVVARWTLLVNDLCREAAVAGTVTLKSAGDQWRDFVPLVDVVRIATLATNAAGLPSATYNLGSGTPATVRSMAARVQDAFRRLGGVEPKLLAPDPSGPAPQPYRVDVSKLAACGVRADGDIGAAVDETARFCIEHRESLRNG